MSGYIADGVPFITLCGALRRDGIPYEIEYEKGRLRVGGEAVFVALDGCCDGRKVRVLVSGERSGIASTTISLDDVKVDCELAAAMIKDRVSSELIARKAASRVR